MKAINLDPGFVPFPEYQQISFKKFDFPSGFEPHIKLQPFECEDGKVLVTARVQSTNDIFTLMLAADALKGNSEVFKYYLLLSFLPFARQDRVRDYGLEPLSTRVMGSMLNMCGFEKVFIYDAHSDVACAVINNAQSITNHEFVKNILSDKEGYYIVSPDAGAFKKVEVLVERLGYKEKIVSCAKARDWETGSLSIEGMTGTDLGGHDVYIIDDICDGGGTFILLSQYLKKRNVGKIFLVVSHGIFSKGIDVLRGHLDGIYTTNSVKDISDTTGFLTQIPLCQTNMNIRF